MVSTKQKVNGLECLLLKRLDCKCNDSAAELQPSYFLREGRELGPDMHDDQHGVQGIQELHFTFQFTLQLVVGEAYDRQKRSTPALKALEDRNSMLCNC